MRGGRQRGCRPGPRHSRRDLLRAAPVVAALALTAASTLAAQDVALRAGGFRTTYADSLRGSAGSVGAEVAWDCGLRAASLAASLATFTKGSWAAQASAAWTETLAASARLAVGLAAEGSGYTFSGGTGAGNAAVGPYASALLGPLVGVAALSAGAVRRIDGSADLLASGTVRLRRAAPRWSAEGWAGLSAAGAQRYGDVGVNARLESERAAVDLVGGRRMGDLGTVWWGQVRGAVRLGGPLWLEAGAGRYPPDVTGFLHGSFAQAGLRVGLGRGTRAAPEPGRVTLAGADEVTVRFTVSDTGVVGVAGEWNAWATGPLETDGAGRFLLRVRLRPGVYRFALVGADGRFFVPPGVPSVPDDFGGAVGLLVVRE